MLPGRFLLSGSSRACEARLTGPAAGLLVEIDGRPPLAVGPVVEISDRLGALPRKLTFADGSVFEVPGDTDLAAVLNRRRPDFLAWVDRIERNWPAVAAFTLVALALMAGLYRWGVPAAAYVAAGATPAGVLAALDAGTLDTVDRLLFEPSALPPERQAEIRQGFETVLLRQVGPDGPPIRLLFRNAPRIGANAFALPGGTIVLTDELVQASHSVDEILGVLGHEIGHVEGRHSLQQIYRAAGLAVMAMLIASDSSEIVDNVLAQASTLTLLAYSRGFEEEADRRSLELMRAAGRRPAAFLDLVDRIQASAGGSRLPSFLASHPQGEGRRTALCGQAGRC